MMFTKNNFQTFFVKISLAFGDNNSKQRNIFFSSPAINNIKYSIKNLRVSKYKNVQKNYPIYWNIIYIKVILGFDTLNRHLQFCGSTENYPTIIHLELLQFWKSYFHDLKTIQNAQIIKIKAQDKPKEVFKYYGKYFYILWQL